MGFEPTCPKPDNRISSAARYDLFDTLPEIILFLKIFALNKAYGRITFTLYTNMFFNANKKTKKYLMIDFFYITLYNNHQRRLYVT